MKSNIILLIALFLLLTTKYSLSQVERVRQFDLIQESDLFLQGSYPPYTIEAIVLGVVTTIEIRELAHCESTTNPEAYNMKDIHYNDDGTISIGSYGLLMFSEPTWREECVERFKIKDNISSPELQIKCAELLLEAGESYRWKRCLQ